MRRSLLLLLLVATLPACEADERAAAPRSDTGFRVQPRGLPTASPLPTPIPTPVTYPQPCGDLYDQAVLPTFELTMPPALWEQMKAEYALKIEEWHGPVTFRYGSETRTDVMIRNRGNNSRCGEKIQIAIGFNRLSPGRRFHGLRRIDLDHGGKSCNTVQERAALAWMRDDLGLPAQCANHARLVVNGDYYGLFTNLEHVDREFLERNFPDPDGNLYKDGWEKKTNESDPDRSDVSAFWAASTPAELDALADLDEALLEWAAEATIPAVDNFWLYGWNYYLYDDPARGFLFLPRDLDQAAPSPSTVALAPLPAAADPALWLLAHDEWRERYLDTLEDVRARLDTGVMASRIDEYWTQVGPAAEADPFLGWSAGNDRFAGLKTSYERRHAFLGDWLDCERRPVAGMDADGDGYRWCQECNDSDPLIFPNAPERCGDLIDDDCDGVADDGCAPPPTPTPTPDPTPTPAPTAPL